MMKRLPLILLGLLCGAAMALAVDVVDAQSKLMLTKQQPDVKRNLLESHPETDYQVFINVNAPADIDRLR